jgi:hypothetical protein
MTPAYIIEYLYRFPDGDTREIRLELDEETMALQDVAGGALPDWTGLDFHRCSLCPLEPAQHRTCPLAAQLARVVAILGERQSIDRVTVEVRVPERTYCKEVDLQEGLSPLTGLIMATGGCPVLEPLRPMARFHLPFASLEETEFRMISMYLTAQCLRQAKGLPADWSMAGLAAIYDAVGSVNIDFAERIRTTSDKDAGINAIGLLHCFSMAVPYAARSLLSRYGTLFSWHMQS